MQAIDSARSLKGELTMNMDEFKKSPVFSFDCGYQKPKVSAENTNLIIEIKRKTVPTNNDKRMNPRALECFLIVLEDKYIELNTKSGDCRDDIAICV